MLFSLFRPEQLREIFERLGYEYGDDTMTRTVDYYDRRTSHGSTLSFVTHAAVLAHLDPESSWERFQIALSSDVDDVQGGTTREGIHMGVMCGTLDLVQRAYAGAHVRDDALCFDPCLPSRLEGMSFPMVFRGRPMLVTLGSDRLTVAVHPEAPRRTLRVGVDGDVRQLGPGERTVFELGSE
jgi:trehalose/maltose hydrolase-like predicted phosphorylase